MSLSLAYLQLAHCRTCCFRLHSCMHSLCKPFNPLLFAQSPCAPLQLPQRHPTFGEAGAQAPYRLLLCHVCMYVCVCVCMCVCVSVRACVCARMCATVWLLSLLPSFLAAYKCIPVTFAWYIRGILILECKCVGLARNVHIHRV